LEVNGGGWLELRGGLEDIQKKKFVIVRGLELQYLDRPACRGSLYRLGYHGSNYFGIQKQMQTQEVGTGYYYKII
jgi:hypothetical protein